MKRMSRHERARRPLTDAPEFALVYRPEVNRDSIEVFVGKTQHLDSVADIPLEPQPGEDVGKTLVFIPYRQAAERGFQVRDDAAPLIALPVSKYFDLPTEQVLRQFPDTSIDLHGAGFDLNDGRYADVVKKVITEEIGNGEGSNFVIKRSFHASISNYSIDHALTIFRRLLTAEHGAYWTFLVRTNSQTFVGASPERHVQLADGVMTMNPVSGTCRYGSSGPVQSDMLRFLHDDKEIDELFMVVDEELKMMSRVCGLGVCVHGPRLKEMARLAHTEYLLVGRSACDVRDVLRETMFAPTVTGSPVENAFRAIHRHEPTPRGYYGGVIALIDSHEDGRQAMDSAIVIRSAEIDPGGQMTIGVGATLVRHSDPLSEVAETHAKVAALLDTLHAGTGGRPAAPTLPTAWHADPVIEQTLRRRNRRLAKFWLKGVESWRTAPELAAKRVLLVDAEDAFTSMLATQITALGPCVEVAPHDQPLAWDDHDLVLVGPGPGDPRQREDPRIETLHQITQRLLESPQRFVSICLGHQILAQRLGMGLVRRQTPNQGRQRVIDFFGRPRRVGFYNTFAAVAEASAHHHPLRGTVEASIDPETQEVEALRGTGFYSMQFHPESVLSVDGVAILKETLTALLLSDQNPVLTTL